MRNYFGMRSVLALVALVALACGVTACASGVRGVASPTTTPATSSPTKSATLSPCVASQLHMTASSDGAASGHIATLYQFTNISQAACTLRGFPSARLLDASGKPLSITVEQVTQAYTWNTTPVKTITLSAGGSAWFRAQTSNVTIQSGVICPVAAHTIIYPPGVATGFTSSIHLSTCDGKVYLSPLVANPNDL